MFRSGAQPLGVLSQSTAKIGVFYVFSLKLAETKRAPALFVMAACFQGIS